MGRGKAATGYPIYKCRICNEQFIPKGLKRVIYRSMAPLNPFKPTVITIFDGEVWHDIPLLTDHRCREYSLMGVADLIGLSL